MAKLYGPPKYNAEDTRADVTRWVTHFAKLTDPTLVVLKGHLLLEELVRQIIEKELPEPKHLEGARLSFDQACCLCRALVGERLPLWVWHGLKALNAIRNLLAHRIDPPELDAKIAALVTAVGRGWEEVTGSPAKRENSFTALQNALTFLLLPLSKELRCQYPTPEQVCVELVRKIVSEQRGVAVAAVPSASLPNSPSA